MKAHAAHPLLVVGVGNALRGDDGAGPAAARTLAGDSRFRVVESAGDPVELIESWRDEPAVILVDAVVSGAPPGTIHRIDCSREPIPAAFESPGSTHGLGLSHAIEISRSLGTLPPVVILFGIEARSMEFRANLSPPVAAAVETVRERVRELEGAATRERCGEPADPAL